MTNHARQSIDLQRRSPPRATDHPLFADAVSAVTGCRLDRWPQQGVLPGPGKRAPETAGARTRACRDAPPCSPARRIWAET